MDNSQLLPKLVRNEDGATVIEYGLIVALISIAAIATMQALGPLLIAKFQAVVTALS
ncbi:MAG: Flp family type IVb pilin [Alphaproteobacteria bacterium]